MPRPLLISSPSDYLIRDKQCRSRSVQKPTDLDLHCLLRQGMPCSAEEGLTLVLLNPNMHCLCKQCNPDQLASDLHCLQLSMWICINNLDQVIWLAENLFSMTRLTLKAPITPAADNAFNLQVHCIHLSFFIYFALDISCALSATLTPK